jgi:SAM-dependent methyltransferase
MSETDAPEVPLPRKEWFDSHYHWAANIIGSWIGEHIDLGRATLVDFGCGDGMTSLGVATHFAPRKVLGVDIRDSFKNLSSIAARMTPAGELPANIAFLQTEPFAPLAGRVEADAVFSWSCFEHIERQHLRTILQDIHDLLPPGGLLFIQIEPLYFSPHGSHLASYIEEPWGHLLMSDEEIRQRVQRAGVREEFERSNTRGANVPMDIRKNYHLRQYSSLNRLTANELLDMARAAGFAVKKQLRSQVELEPDAALLKKFGREALVTNEIRVLFEKSPAAARGLFATAKRMLRL